MNRRASVNLNPIYKGSDWSVSFPLTRNGLSFLGGYASFTCTLRQGDEETGTVVPETSGRVGLTDYFNITVTDTDIAALIAGTPVFWEVKGVLSSGIIEPIAKGRVEVETGAAAV